MSTHYDVDHLSDDELRATTAEVYKHWQASLTQTADPTDLLYADPDELSEEYQFWAGQLERRSGYVNCTATEDD